MYLKKKFLEGPDLVPEGNGSAGATKPAKKDTKGRKPQCVKKDGDHKFRSPCNY
jgi:hypothetical protein